MRFGQLLRQLRKERQLGIKKLAPDLDVNYTYLSKLENDKAIPSEELVRRIARYFDYDADKLLLAADRVPGDAIAIIRRRPDLTLRYLRRVGSRGRRRT